MRNSQNFQDSMYTGKARAEIFIYTYQLRYNEPELEKMAKESFANTPEQVLRLMPEDKLKETLAILGGK